MYQQCLSLIVHRTQLQANACKDNNMKKLSATLVLAVVVIGMSPRISYAETDRFTIWDELDAAVAKLFNDQQIDEYEDLRMEEVLGLGRTRKTDQAISALNGFLKDSRNVALREIARNTFVTLIKQQKEAADNWGGHSKDKPACTLDMKVCSSGEIVGREGSRCTFAKCPGRELLKRNTNDQ